ncbi:hypothetical protein HY410_00025 [Candidatus Gottesmanbacteria bacterium]|nr:hypothetical protein [Candidatus Gottesmanbacteria bacterium]
MPYRVRSLVLIIVGIGLIAGLGVGGFFWYEKRNKPQEEGAPSFGRSFPKIDTSTIATHNQTIAQKSSIPPYYAIGGIMRSETGASSYAFDAQVEEAGRTSIFPLSGSSVRHGPIYREYRGIIAPVSLGELGRQDQIYLTYYANFESGMVMGVIGRLVQTSGTTILYLLDDPDLTGYRVSETMDFAVSDPSKYFGLSGKDPIELAQGNIVWGEFTPSVGKSGSTVPLSKLTLRSPPYRTARGVVGDVEMVSEGAVTFRLDSLPSTITADRDTIVYRHGANLPLPGSKEWESKNLGIAALKDGQEVSVFMYLAGDRWQALSIGIRGVAP